MSLQQLRSTTQSDGGGAWTAWTPVITGEGAMTVSGTTVFSARYLLVGKTMHLSFYVTGITLGGTPSSSIKIAIPESKLPAVSTVVAVRAGTPGLAQIPAFSVTDNSTGFLYLQKADATNWANASGQGYAATVALEVQ